MRARERVGQRSPKQMYEHGESLVEVQMAYIPTACRGVCESDLSIQVCTVEVNLATVFVYNPTCLRRLSIRGVHHQHIQTHVLNAYFKDTEGRRVGDLGDTFRLV